MGTAANRVLWRVGRPDPYMDPGYTLGRHILKEAFLFNNRNGWQPKTILMQNNGIIATGGHYREVVAALAMVEECARILAGVAVLPSPVCMNDYQVHRIASRADEEYRKRLLIYP